MSQTSIKKDATFDNRFLRNGLLVFFAKRGWTLAVRFLLWAGASANAINPETNDTVLHEASKLGHTQIVAWLLDYGADITAQTQYQSTPLHFATTFGHKDVIQLLIDKGASLTAQTNLGRTPLYQAILQKHSVDIIGLLASENAVNKATPLSEGAQTPLHAAVIFGRGKTSAIIQKLLECGATVETKNADGKTPLKEALQREYFDIAKLLFEASKDHVSPEESASLLRLAQKHRDTAFISQLSAPAVSVPFVALKTTPDALPEHPHVGNTVIQLSSKTRS